MKRSRGNCSTPPKIDIFSPNWRAAAPTPWPRSSIVKPRSESWRIYTWERWVRELGEEILELLSPGAERELFQPAPLGFDNGGRAHGCVLEQLERDGMQLLDAASLPAKIWKSDSLDRAVAANTNCPGEKRVARDLTGDAAAIQLQDDFVFGDLAQVLGVGFALIDHAQFSFGEFHFGKQLRAFASVEIENGHRLVG